jgi:Outer membrane protein beta-barrel domain
MKKILLVAVSLTASMLIYAQGNVHFGLKGGINVASLNVQNEVDFNSRTSFNLGGLAHIHVSPHFAVQPEVYFSGQGGQDNGEVVRLNYINVPVLLQYMGGNGFRLQTGPQLGFLVSAKDELDHVTVDIKDNLNAAEFGWSFGAGYLFPNTGVGIDARYNLGISNIRDDGGNNTTNRVFQIGLFYQFMH